MQIEKFTLNHLKSIINDNDYWNRSEVPMTRHRMLSYIHNPRAHYDDIVLFTAFEENKLVGYLNILPDNIKLKDNSYKIGWISSWWVSEHFRSSGVGAFLFYGALKHYNQSLAGVRYNENAGNIIKASRRFTDLNDIKKTIFILKIQPGRLERSILYNILITLTKPVAVCINSGLNILYNRKRKIYERLNTYDGIKIEYVNWIDDEIDKFINTHQKNNLIKRSAAEFNWILRYPWILSAPGKYNMRHNYQFADISPRFFYIAVKLFKKDNLIGFLLLKFRDDYLDIPYIYYNPEYQNEIVYAIFQQAYLLSVQYISIYDDKLIKSIINKRNLYLYSRNTTYKSAITNKYTTYNLSKYSLQGGDGDLVFY